MVLFMSKVALKYMLLNLYFFLSPAGVNTPCDVITKIWQERVCSE